MNCAKRGSTPNDRTLAYLLLIQQGIRPGRVCSTVKLHMMLLDHCPSPPFG